MPRTKPAATPKAPKKPGRNRWLPGQSGNPAGAKPILATPEDLDQLTTDYLAMCAADDRPPWIGGLALHVGYSAEGSLREHCETTPLLSAAYARAKARVASAIYELAHKYPKSGVLQRSLAVHHGWTEETRVALSGQVEQQIIHVVRGYAPVLDRPAEFPAHPPAVLPAPGDALDSGPDLLDSSADSDDKSDT